mgnify:CR=1 FL=1
MASIRLGLLPLEALANTRFYDALKEIDVDAKFYVPERPGHGGSKFKSPVVASEVLTFFERNLKHR